MTNKNSIRKLLAVMAIALVAIVGISALAPTTAKHQSPISLKSIRLDKMATYAGTCPGGGAWFREVVSPAGNQDQMKQLAASL